MVPTVSAPTNRPPRPPRPTNPAQLSHWSRAAVPPVVCGCPTGRVRLSCRSRAAVLPVPRGCPAGHAWPSHWSRAAVPPIPHVRPTSSARRPRWPCLDLRACCTGSCAAVWCSRSCVSSPSDDQLSKESGARQERSRRLTRLMTKGCYGNPRPGHELRVRRLDRLHHAARYHPVPTPTQALARPPGARGRRVRTPGGRVAPKLPLTPSVRCSRSGRADRPIPEVPSGFRQPVTHSRRARRRPFGSG
jgi:hypothetical protein